MAGVGIDVIGIGKGWKRLVERSETWSMDRIMIAQCRRGCRKAIHVYLCFSFLVDVGDIPASSLTQALT